MKDICIILLLSSMITYSNASLKWQDCPENDYCASTDNGATECRDNQCQSCGVGHTSPGCGTNYETKCSLGQSICTDARVNCTRDGEYMYNNGTARYCRRCQDGHGMPDHGVANESTCNGPCNPGYFTPSHTDNIDLLSCQQCASGKYTSGYGTHGSCTSCSAGKWSGRGASACTNHGAHNYSTPIGATSEAARVTSPWIFLLVLLPFFVIGSGNVL